MSSKSRVITSNGFAINYVTIFEFGEVITKFFSHFVLGQRTFNTSIRTEFLVQGICLFERSTVLRLEDIIISFNKVEEDICLQHHLKRTIAVIIILPQRSINIQTMLCDSTKLKIYLRHQCVIVIWRKFYT